MAWTTVPVTGQELGADGGTVTFELTARMVNQTLLQSVPRRRLTVKLDSAGRIPDGTVLYATDEPSVEPDGVAWRVIVRGIPDLVEPWVGYLNVAHTAASVDLSEATPQPPSAAAWAYASQAALAALNAEVFLPGMALDGITDDSPAINALAANSGKRRIGYGVGLLKSPISVAKYNMLEGSAATTDVDLTNGLLFDPTTIMPGSYPVTVTADGANWVFTGLPTGHPLKVGQTFLGSGFASGFNVRIGPITAVGANSVTVANTTVPAASDTGTIKTTACSITADGTWWKVTVPTGWGSGVIAAAALADSTRRPSFTITGSPTAGFNTVCLIDHIVGNDAYVAKASIPAASSTGLVRLHLIRLGSMTDYAPAVALKNLYVECSSIPGNIPVYSYSIQEHGGIDDGVTIRGGMYRSVVIDSSDPLGNNKHALNYRLADWRSIGSTLADSLYSGLEINGGAASIRGGEKFTCTGGGTGAFLPDAQIRLNDVRGSFDNGHVENCKNGILIGELAACPGLRITNITGNPTCETVVRIAVPPAPGVNSYLDIRNINPNGSTNSIVDDLSGVAYTNISREFATDALGQIIHNSPATGRKVVTLTGTPTADKVLDVDHTDSFFSTSVTPGVYRVRVDEEIIPDAGVTAAKMRIRVGSEGTANLSGIRSAPFPINGTAEVKATLEILLVVTATVTLFVQTTLTGGPASGMLKADMLATGYGDASAMIITPV
jgi:hypothetical protein